MLSKITPAALYVVTLAILAGVFMAIDAYPLHFAGLIALLIVVGCGLGASNEAKARTPLSYVVAVCRGIGMGLLVCLALAAFIIVGGLLGVGSECAPHRPYAC